ncbi:MAG TPA: hypothetical protein VFS00_29870, partial [Polyangiaceae bacterium]|nr:hypothetical protein [Polyangiaceae bacterium]
MRARLAAPLAANLAYPNLVALFLELAARTLSPALHATVSAVATTSFVVALVLRDRLGVVPSAGALFVAFCLLVTTLAYQHAPLLPALLLAVPYVAALALLGRRDVRPLVRALLFPLGALVAWLACEGAYAHYWLLYVTPQVLLDVRLLRRADRAPGARALAALALGPPLLAAAVALLERYVGRRDEASRAAQQEVAERAYREARVAALRGDVAGACELFALDPTSDFEACRRSVEAAIDARERWRRVGPFFWWDKDRRVLDRKTPAQRRWALEAYARAWAALPDAEFDQSAGNACQMLDHARDETKRALGPDVRAAMIERLETRLRADVSRYDRPQLERALAFVRALD